MPERSLLKELQQNKKMPAKAAQAFIPDTRTVPVHWKKNENYMSFP
jgi:hypothetical protein